MPPSKKEPDRAAAQPSPADYQQAAARDGGAVPYGQAAAQAVGQVIDPAAAGGDADAGATIEQIRQQVTRDVLLPMETRIEQMMADARAAQEAMAAQIAQLQGQLAGAQAQLGDPAHQLYAESVANRVRSLQAAHPQADLSGPIRTADGLAQAARDVAAGTATADTLARLAAPLERHFTAVAPHLEGAATVLAELGHLADEAAKIAA